MAGIRQRFISERLTKIKMKTKNPFLNWCTLVVIIFLSSALLVAAQSLQLVSALPDSSFAPAGGNGDSYLPIATPDGRYVLFASGADNLVLTNSNGSIPNTPLHYLNVFLRDRISGTTTLVSANLQGNGGNGNSYPTGISTNGQFALFESSASDLVSGDANSANDIFVRDLVHNATRLVSVSTNGTSGNGNSRSSSITPDGRYVVFVSEANNLTADDTNGIPNVFVRDLQSNTTTLASVGAISANLSYLVNSSESPEITPDGRYVAFDSTATNLVSGVLSSGEVYVRDLVGGTTIWASTNAQNLFQSVYGTPNEISCHADISSDGQFVAFETCTTNLTTLNAQGIVQRFNLQTDATDIIYTNANAPLTSPLENINNLDITPDGRFVAYVANTTNSGGNTAIYLWDSQTGTNTLVSADQTSGLPANGNCDVPVVTPDGRYIAFISNATNLTANVLDSSTNTLPDKYHLYLRDTIAGTTQLIDADTNGTGIKIDSQTVPQMTDDGSLIFYDRIDGGLVANDNNHDSDVFACHVANGTNELISAHESAQPSQFPNGFNTLYSTSVSTNGRYIAFASDADNLAPNDTNGFRDVFIRDLWMGTNAIVSIGTNGFTGTNISAEPSITADGRYVAFSSGGTRLAPGRYIYGIENIFVRDLQAGTTALITTNVYSISSAMTADSFTPIISSDGRYILFHSKANPDSLTMDGLYNNGIENLFLHDQQLSTNYALTVAQSGTGVTSATMTPDGHYVAYLGVISGSANYLYVWDSQALQRIYTNTSASIANIAMSADGRWLTYIVGGGSSTLNAFDLIARTNCQICTGSFPSRPGLQFSADDRFFVFSTQSALVGVDTNGTYDVYLRDFQTGTNILISKNFSSGNSANNRSDSPVISSDGRYIAYHSSASDIVPSDTNGAADLFLYLSAMPVFSADNSTLVFESFASDLMPGFNEYNAIYALNLSALGGGGGDDTNVVLSTQIFGVGGSGQNQSVTNFTPTINWPVIAGKSYQVQYKNDLSDPVWQNVTGNITIEGSQGRITDLTPAADHRFYRIVQN
jgi:Tol biopolymer transport system component